MVVLVVVAQTMVDCSPHDGVAEQRQPCGPGVQGDDLVTHGLVHETIQVRLVLVLWTLPRTLFAFTPTQMVVRVMTDAAGATTAAAAAATAVVVISPDAGGGGVPHVLVSRVLGGVPYGCCKIALSSSGGAMIASSIRRWRRVEIGQGHNPVSVSQAVENREEAVLTPRHQGYDIQGLF